MPVIRTRRPSAATRLALLLVAVACGVVFASFSPVSLRPAAAQTAVEDKFVYYTTGAEVFVANADGTGVTPLGPGHGPAWSPDAQKIVFANSPNGPETSLIYSMKADGTERTRLSDGHQDFQPSYSPDGSQIVFVSVRSDPTFPPGDDLGHTYRLFLMDADGGNERKLFASGLRAEHVPVFSPDGARVAFVGMALSATGTSEYNVYVVDADGTNMRRLTNYEGFQIDPGDAIAFSRDGQRVVYTHGRDLKSVNVEGPGLPVTLTNTLNRDEFGPTFSPEGTKLAYFANDFDDNAADGIYILDIASQGVVFTGINGRNPRWMPRPVVEPTPTPTPTPVPASADLSVLMTASPNPGVGRDLTYTLRVDNHGPDAATAVSLNFVPPVGVNFVSAETTQGQCSTGPGSTQCLLGDLASGASATVAILTVPTAAGEVTALSTVSSAVDDPAQNNNAQPLTINVSATCVPEVTGEVVARVIRNGNQSRKQLKHTIVAQNTSGRRLHGLVHFVLEGIDPSVSGDKGLILRESRCLAPLGTRYASVGVGNSTELVWEPGQVITFEVDLYNPERVPVGYSLRVYTGPGYP
jgi:uncharacterized repeat protein (TIGR01451 family)